MPEKQLHKFIYSIPFEMNGYIGIFAVGNQFYLLLFFVFNFYQRASQMDFILLFIYGAAISIINHFSNFPFQNIQWDRRENVFLFVVQPLFGIRFRLQTTTILLTNYFVTITTAFGVPIVPMVGHENTLNSKIKNMIKKRRRKITNSQQKLIAIFIHSFLSFGCCCFFFLSFFFVLFILHITLHFPVFSKMSWNRD